MADKNKPASAWKKNANIRRTRGLIETELLQLFEIHHDLPVAAHLVNILRSKGNIVGKRADGSPIFRDPYYMEDEQFLKELENYREQQDRKVMEDKELEEEETTVLPNRLLPKITL